MRSAPFILGFPGTVACRDFPVARNNANASTTSERLPKPWRASCPTGPAAYRFVILDAAGCIVAFYCGETEGLAKRIGQYAGMTRRLLALHGPAAQVMVEKHPLRHIHYHLADALLTPGRRIELSYWKLPAGTCKKDREKVEGNMRKRFARCHPIAQIIHSKGKGNFESNPPVPLPPHWQTAHNRLIKALGRKRSAYI